MQKKGFNVENFSKGLMQGYQSAIESLVNPEEGTIITVMRDVANKAHAISNEGCTDYIPFVREIFKESEHTLKLTKTTWKLMTTRLHCVTVSFHALTPVNNVYSL